MKIKVFISDVDGTMTDGRVYVDSQGNETVAYSKIDGEGVKRLRYNNIPFFMISNEKNIENHKARSEKLNCGYLPTGLRSKEEVLRKFLERQGYHWSEIAYMGDDVSDMECMLKAGFSICPADSILVTMNFVPDFITDRKGGEGAVREAIEYILENNNEG